MKKSMAVFSTSIAFFVTSIAMAAPAASGTPNAPCTHCGMSKTSTLARGGLFGMQAKPCRHIAAAKVRWGNSQQPCPHCTHSA